MKVCIFEDSAVHNLNPLVLMRPSFELKCGHTRLFEKIIDKYPDAEVAFIVRDYLKDVTAERFGKAVNDFSWFDEDTLFVNGRHLALGNKPIEIHGEEAGVCDNGVVYAMASRETIAKVQAEPPEQFVEKLVEGLPQEDVKDTLVSFPWDLVHKNVEAIEDDFLKMEKTGAYGKIHPLSCIYGPEENVYIAPTAEIQPCVVIDTTGGAVIIDDGVVVNPHTRIEGPTCIGRDSAIVGAKIREGTSIGPVCKVGGEVEESIIHGYSNKYHDGFLGHAYVCEWVNLGALATNSDLKNDYSTVELYLNGELTDSGDTKVGSFIGDHTKLSIGSLLNTGTIIGIFDNLVAGGGVLPKYNPSFVWVINNKPMKGAGVKTMIRTAKTVMSRRDVDMSPAEQALVEYLFTDTSKERRELIKKARQK